ncbi:E3 ubiquitin-protein ligase MARCHF3 isoform X1 [Stegostoma tigrinum]|uniref:E3 ubiquitin-protein ligase MARCHF3 isoform X1 n=1 Tax=Stegostoma tigrinum TaxID=3053191 RepID=UPI00202B4EF2|nr:E3 ubiquitin-protein ligase MARCHF3 isoform X1 [Stegostoma tigrinum]XP_048418996.1 E3 ubiquitin-protein ligase MARCHF3 isoform X1 [Stegostoma tigrinum]XP_048418997.1 E3 ubiquitin-protein ligase MARCHF3 isoform X1 [Stegostoma tigrinum]XP_048418998.1 E3 ubiquitin-protein ligase MARCHF3 isoform X1 [Stegostoma tigrinum]XP_048418999.1 E3 ubiquitin-protein ligase MARCHF3 isoform X1 [Stegostoma tigrinum]XP_048419000.1 E3 ubiquitin-protein ligase MARCHF3 isoform X1 [Stegostoma tigrinum]XP_04841900
MKADNLQATECQLNNVCYNSPNASWSVNLLSENVQKPQYVVEGSGSDGHLPSSVTVTSSISSDIPICRICHEPSDKESLLSPCECAGTLGTVHRSCLEQWLAASCSNHCEVCHFEFALERMPRPLTEWLKDPALQQKRRMLCGDIICFLFITPLASLSGWLCVQGTVDHFYFSSSVEAVGLLILSAVLITIYLLWTTASFRYHFRLLKDWRRTNQNVKLLIPKSQVLFGNKANLLAQNSSIIVSKETIV